MAGDNQKEFDFPRAEKLRAIDRANFPKGLDASPGAMKAVLRCLDSHIRAGEACRLKLSTISAETGFSKRTARKAIAVLRKAMIVATVTTGRSNVFSIEWKRLALITKTGHSERQNRPLRAAVSAGQSGIYGRSTEAPTEAPTETYFKTPGAKPRRSKEASPPEAAAEPPGERVLNDEERRFLAIAKVVLRRGGPNAKKDQELVWCVARLVASGEIAENTLEQALEAMRLNTPRNRPAYFRSAIVNGCRAAGFSFHQLEKNYEVEAASKQADRAS